VTNVPSQVPTPAVEPRPMPWPTDGISYGGDYNPEQWPREVWDEDVRLMHEAGVNFVTLGVFAWGTADGRRPGRRRPLLPLPAQPHRRRAQGRGEAVGPVVRLPAGGVRVLREPPP
jgi:hypothetical protein